MRAAQKGLKMSCIICSSTTNGQGSFFENHGFDPFLNHFVVPNWPIFTAFLALRGAKIAQHGPKKGSFKL